MDPDAPDDFCDTTPMEKMVSLQLGCQSPDGADVYDVGTCHQHPCCHAAGNHSCQDEKEFCCGPTGYSRVDLVCDEGTDFIFVVSTWSDHYGWL